jgi:5'(3')-deoxyribonucleotidase
MPLIMIDLDDTIWEFFEPLLYQYNITYNTNIQFSEITDYDFSSKLSIPIDMFFKRFLTEKVFMSFRPFPNAIETINNLYHKYYNLYEIRFVTSGFPVTMPWRQKKLERLFDWFTPKHLIMCQDKQLIKGDILIDDSIKNFIGECSYKPIIPDRPWNRDSAELTKCYNNPIKIFSWDSELIIRLIDDIIEHRERR